MQSKLARTQTVSRSALCALVLIALGVARPADAQTITRAVPRIGPECPLVFGVSEFLSVGSGGGGFWMLAALLLGLRWQCRSRSIEDTPTGDTPTRDAPTNTRRWLASAIAASIASQLACSQTPDSPGAPDAAAIITHDAGSFDARLAPDAGGVETEHPLADYWVEAGESVPPNSTRRIIYLNFVGGVFAHGPTAAAINSTNVGVGQFDFVLPFRAEAFFRGRTGAQRTRDSVLAHIVEDVRASFDGLDLDIVTSRPSSEAFMMVVIGGSASDIGYSISSALGVTASSACFASQIQEGGTAFAFSKSISQESLTEHPTHVARTITHEIGHMVGLRHSTDEQSIMHAPHGSGWGVGAPVEQTCQRPIQDDRAVLEETVGLSITSNRLVETIDALAPEVSVGATAKGTLLVTATDDSKIRYVMLRAHVDIGDPVLNRPALVDEQIRFAPPYEFEVAGIESQATIEISAVDRWDNRARVQGPF